MSKVVNIWKDKYICSKINSFHILKKTIFKSEDHNRTNTRQYNSNKLMGVGTQFPSAKMGKIFTQPYMLV